MAYNNNKQKTKIINLFKCIHIYKNKTLVTNYKLNNIIVIHQYITILYY